MEPTSDSPASERPILEQGRGVDRIERDASVAPGASPHPWDGYLTGPENELAMAAAQAMARGEDQGLSPMVLHGPSGVGKSRLLAGLVAERLRWQPGSAVAHLDAESFAAAYVESAGEPAGSGWAALRGRFRGVDLFVLEDLEGLERAPVARDELVHTLDALEAAGAVVAVSARSAPGTWPRPVWPARLISRLMGGLTVRIEPPGLPSRRRYVLHCAAAHGLSLQAETVELLAQAADGYRTLDGWIARLALEERIGRQPQGRGRGSVSGTPAPQRLQAHPIDPQTAATILAEETVLASPVLTIDAVTRSVAARFGIRLGLLRGPSRRASIVEARHLAMHLARTLTGSSFAAVGTYFGSRDPATVRHACKAAVERLNADPALAAAVATIGRGRHETDA
jgi:chromosomal replication initiator protein